MQHQQVLISADDDVGLPCHGHLQELVVFGVTAGGNRIVRQHGFPTQQDEADDDLDILRVMVEEVTLKLEGLKLIGLSTNRLQQDSDN